MRAEILELIKKARASSFNRNNYSVHVDLRSFVSSMLLHTWYDKKETSEKDVSVSNKEWLDRVIPDFQRANNKWNKSMKLKFVENILNGAKTELLLFRMEEDGDAQIIDGLQRTTALIDFFDGKIKPFGYSYSELKDSLRAFPDNISIKIYTFSTWEEVGRFYIDMNENITHSKADIQKAKDWFLAEHNIEL